VNEDSAIASSESVITASLNDRATIDIPTTRPKHQPAPFKNRHFALHIFPEFCRAYSSRTEVPSVCILMHPFLTRSSVFVLWLSSPLDIRTSTSNLCDLAGCEYGAHSLAAPRKMPKLSQPRRGTNARGTGRINWHNPADKMEKLGFFWRLVDNEAKNTQSCSSSSLHRFVLTMCYAMRGRCLISPALS
jgi:hypothetical protein